MKRSILPAMMLSLKLEPSHFFKESPAIGVPPEHEIKNVEQRKTANQKSFATDSDVPADD
jgi:primary-amine oxidase